MQNGSSIHPNRYRFYMVLAVALNYSNYYFYTALLAAVIFFLF